MELDAKTKETLDKLEKGELVHINQELLERECYIIEEVFDMTDMYWTEELDPSINPEWESAFREKIKRILIQDWADCDMPDIVKEILIANVEDADVDSDDDCKREWGALINYITYKYADRIELYFSEEPESEMMN